MRNKICVNIDLVKCFMETNGIDEKQLAELMGVKATKVKGFLSNPHKANMRIKIVFNLARALNVGLLDLICQNC